MFRTIFTLFCLLWTTPAFSNTTVVTKFGIGSPPNLVLRYMIDQFNKDSDESFKIVYLTGGQGNLADQYAIDVSKTNDVLWFGGLSTFTINLLETNNNKLDHFELLSTVTKSSMELVVNKKSKWNTLEDFLITNKHEKLFFGTLSRSNFPVFLNHMFLNQHRLSSKTLVFSTYGEVGISLEKNESTYSIMPKGSVPNVKPIFTFDYSGNTLFAIPKNNLRKISLYKTLIEKTCKDIEFNEFSKKLNYDIVCVKGKELYDLRDKELELYKNYFDKK